MTTTIAQWVEILGNADATNEGDAMAAARKILMTTSVVPRKLSVENMANALQAYAYLLQQHGVTVVLD